MKRRYPNLVNAYAPIHTYAGITGEDGKQVWVPARGLGYPGILHAIRLAWGVFRGRYDALAWPGQ